MAPLSNQYLLIVQMRRATHQNDRLGHASLKNSKLTDAHHVHCLTILIERVFLHFHHDGPRQPPFFIVKVRGYRGSLTYPPGSAHHPGPSSPNT